MTRTALLLPLVLPLLGAACASLRGSPPEIPIAPIWVLHADELDPAHRGRYEEALRLGARVRAENRFGAESASFKWLEGESTYVNARPSERFADLDAGSDFERFRAALGPDRFAEHMREVHDPLRGHGNEILRYRESRTYRSSRTRDSVTPPERFTVRREWVVPRMRDTYDAILAEIRGALESARHASSVLAFSVYAGRGSDLYLVEDAGPAVAARDLEESLRRALGAARARDLLARRDACLEKVETVEAVPRLDLAYRSEGWPGWIGRPPR